MSNHARGLWGYYGETASGRALTVQSTGIGGPSAALVLSDLAELGARRAIRVGTCVGLAPGIGMGELLVVRSAIAAGGSAGALGVEAGATLRPDSRLSDRLLAELGEGCAKGAVLSVDFHPTETGSREGAIAADMQTAPLLAQSARLGVEIAAVLIVAEAKAGDSSERLGKEPLEEAERRAGRAACLALSS